MSEQLQFAQFAEDPMGALEALISQALWRAPVPLPQKARELLMILRWYKGAHNARPLAEIAAKLKVSDREVKQHAKTLTEEYGIPVGGSRQQPYGYFLCVTAEDYAAARRPYVHEVRSLVERLKFHQPSQRLMEILGQLRAELGEGEEKKSA